MKPAEAFKAFTYVSARSLNLKDYGKIDVGYKFSAFLMDYTPEEWAYRGELKPKILQI
jgi:imidazolonepropionase-like amidohydrolase